jgi:hypothetical protein
VEISNITMYIYSHAVLDILGLEGQSSCRLKYRVISIPNASPSQAPNSTHSTMSRWMPCHICDAPDGRTACMQRKKAMRCFRTPGWLRFALRSTFNPVLHHDSKQVVQTARAIFMWETWLGVAAKYQHGQLITEFFSSDVPQPKLWQELKFIVKYGARVWCTCHATKCKNERKCQTVRVDGRATLQ